MHTNHQIAATYARVSTVNQKEGISLQQQEGEMLTYATMHSIEAKYRFQEQASGYNGDREDYNRIRSLIHKGNITDLIVYSSDRYTRNPIDGELFRQELNDNGIALHIVSEGGSVDIQSPSGQFIRRQMDIVNSFIGEQLKRTMYEKKQAYIAAGIPYVSGFAKYGYDRVGKRKDAYVVIVEDEAEVVRSIYSWYTDHDMNVHQIADLLSGIPAPGDKVYNPKRQRASGEWATSTIYNILHDPIYRGVYYANRTKMVKNSLGQKIRQALSQDNGWIAINVPGIVDADLWERAQVRMEKRKKQLGTDRNAHEYLISSRSVCRHCGASVTANTGSNKIGYYRCNRRYAKFYVEQGCDFKPIRVDKTDFSVWEELKKLFKKPQALRALLLEAQDQQRKEVGEIDKLIENIDRILGERNKQLKGFTNAIAAEYQQTPPNADIIAALRGQAADLAKVINDLEEEKERHMQRYNTKVISPAYIENSVAYAESIAHLLDNAPYEVQKEAIEHFDFRFEFERDNQNQVIVHIQWLIWEWSIPVAAAEAHHSPSESSPSARCGIGYAKREPIVITITVVINC
jgi:site-specific DNA recombinase